MKPASLQDAIKASALKKQQPRIAKEGWKEPLLVATKKTADHEVASFSVNPSTTIITTSNMRITPPPKPSTSALNGGSSSRSGSNNDTNEVMAMKQQIEDLKKEMRFLKSEMKYQQSSSSLVLGGNMSIGNLSHNASEEKKDASDSQENDDNDDLRAELQTLRAMLKAAEVEKLLPRMKKLYVQVKELDSQMEAVKKGSSPPSSPSRRSKVVVDHSSEEQFKQLHAKIAQDYTKLQKQKADACELDAVLQFCADQDTSIQKHLHEIQQQGETIQKQQKTMEHLVAVISTHEREIELLKSLVRDVAQTAQVAKEMAEKAQQDVQQQQQREKVAAAAKAEAAAEHNKQLLAKKEVEEDKPPQEGSFSLGLSSSALMVKDDDDDDEDSIEVEPKPKQVEHTPSFGLERTRGIGVARTLSGQSDRSANHNHNKNSEEVPSSPCTRGRSRSRSNLYAADTSDDGSEMDAEASSGPDNCHRRQPSRSRSRTRASRRDSMEKLKLLGLSDSCAQFEVDAADLFHSKSERKIVTRDDVPLTPLAQRKPKSRGLLAAPVSPLTQSEDDDLFFSSSSSNHKKNNMKNKANKSMSDLQIPDLKSCASSSDSVDSSDHEEINRGKKTINLLPHRSETLYEEQRKDSVLRRFMKNREKTPNMSVRTVHGYNLVFFSDRIYIPIKLREQTMEYYKKKYRYSPISALERNCFWPDMKTDMRNYHLPETRWRVCDAVVDEV